LTVRILLAEDELVSRRLLASTLTGWGYQIQVTMDGLATWEALQAADAPKLAILDWMMPGMDGPNVCRKVRALPTDQPPYLLLLTARDDKSDIIAGLEAGADDYLTKPFDRGELLARLKVGVRMLGLQQCLAERVRQLGEALANVTQLQGLLPICCYCHKIRDDHNFWQRVETYISTHSSAQFSHGVCPECLDKVLKADMERRQAGSQNTIVGASAATKPDIP